MFADRGEAFKEICANFGAAMYFVQVLEHGIANSLLFLKLIPETSGKWTDEEYEEFFEQQFEKTLGNLIVSLKAVAAVPGELVASLQEAKRRRAFLAHHFFRERSDLIQVGHYQPVLDELEGHRQFFQTTDRALEAFVRPVMQRYGFTDETLAKAMQEYEAYVHTKFNEHDRSDGV